MSAAAEQQIGMQAQSADPKVAGTEQFVDEWAAAEAEADRIEAAREGKPAPKEEPKKAAEPKKDGEPEPEKPKAKAGVEGKKTARDFAAERILRKEIRAELEQEFSGKLAEADRIVAELGTATPAKLKEFYESGRADELAKVLTGKDDATWNDINDHFARLFASPEYKRIKQLEDDKKQRDQADAAKRRDDEARQLQAREAETWANAQVEVADALKVSDDTILAKFGEDEHFCAEVLRRVVAAGGEKEIEDVANEVLDGIVERVTRWNETLGDRLAAKKAEAAKAATPDRAGSKKQPEKPHKHVSRNQATEASAALPDNMSDDDWLKHGAEAMRDAYRRDEEERRARA